MRELLSSAYKNITWDLNGFLILVSKKFVTRYNTVIFGGTSGFGKHLVDLIEKDQTQKYLYLGQ